MTVWYNIWPFGIVCGHLVYFSRFGMFGTRKIWQHRGATFPSRFLTSFFVFARFPVLVFKTVFYAWPPLGSYTVVDLLRAFSENDFSMWKNHFSKPEKEAYKLKNLLCALLLKILKNLFFSNTHNGNLY
jgi:hypothetical protein